MAIFRIDKYNNAKLLNIPKEKEKYFLSQKFYDVTYIKVDNPPKSDFGFYKYNPDNNQIEVDMEKELEMWKRKKKQEIKQAFLDTLSNGYITSIGIKIDSKLSDLQNLEIGLSYAKLKNLSTIQLRDYYNKLHSVDISTFEQIITELKQFIIDCLEKKWKLQKEVDDSNDIESIKSIKWE